MTPLLLDASHLKPFLKEMGYAVLTLEEKRKGSLLLESLRRMCILVEATLR